MSKRLPKLFLLILICFCALFLLNFFNFKDRPKISFSHNHYDLGRLLPGEVKKFHFFIINNTTQTITITDLLPSCPVCTQAVIAQKKLPPGKKGKVQVVFDAAGFQGEINKSITVIVDKKDRYNYSFQCFVQKILAIDPQYLKVDLSKVQPGAKLLKKIKITNLSQHKIKIKNISFTNKKLKHVKIIAKPERLLPQKSAYLKLFVKRPSPLPQYLIQSLTVATDFPAAHPQSWQIFVIHTQVPAK